MPEYAYQKMKILWKLHFTYCFLQFEGPTVVNGIGFRYDDLRKIYVRALEKVFLGKGEGNA